jgi:hypothetical protein
VLDALFSAEKPSGSPTRPGSGGGGLRRTASKAGGDPGTSSSKALGQAGAPGQAQQGGVEIKVLSTQKEFNLRIILKKLGVAPRVLARHLNELDSSALDVSGGVREKNPPRGWCCMRMHAARNTSMQGLQVVLSVSAHMPQHHQGCTGPSAATSAVLGNFLWC